VSRRLDDQRLDDMGRFAHLPADRAALWPNLSVDEAGDLLWTLNAYAVPDLLVVPARMAPERHRDRRANILARALLPDNQPQLHPDGSFEHPRSRRPSALRREAIRLIPAMLPGHPMRYHRNGRSSFSDV